MSIEQSKSKSKRMSNHPLKRRDEFYECYRKMLELDALCIQACNSNIFDHVDEWEDEERRLLIDMMQINRYAKIKDTVVDSYLQWKVTVLSR